MSLLTADNTFDNHITLVCHAYYCHLRDLLSLNKLLTVDTAVPVANVMVSSRLDLCNSLLHEVTKVSIAKMQKVKILSTALTLGWTE